MADITKCLNINCPQKENCYRFTAVSKSEYQSYANFQYDYETKHCIDYWEDKNPFPNMRKFTKEEAEEAEEYQAAMKTLFKPTGRNRFDSIK